MKKKVNTYLQVHPRMLADVTMARAVDLLFPNARRNAAKFLAEAHPNLKIVSLETTINGRRIYWQDETGWGPWPFHWGPEPEIVPDDVKVALYYEFEAELAP